MNSMSHTLIHIAMRPGSLSSIHPEAPVCVRALFEARIIHVELVKELFQPPLRAPSSRCDQCNPRQKESTRNLVVCIDGTSHQLEDGTNVGKLFQKIMRGGQCPEQISRYFEGIGADSKLSHIAGGLGKAFINKIDMVVAWNIGETVKKAYGWLAGKYQEGDQIYLFGFSRGAYQVRVLAAMINEVGLIKAPTEKDIAMVYDLCTERIPSKEAMRLFKSMYHGADVRVHFVGIWDTVSSVGLMKGDNFLSASSSSAHACHFRHALALDELRVKFMPEYFEEIHSQSDDEHSGYVVTPPSVLRARSLMHERRGSTMSDDEADPFGGKHNRAADVKEVWFAGGHSDVGGKDRPGKSHHAGNVSLSWMRREAAANGLVLQPVDRVWVPDDIDLGTCNSMTNVWRFAEYLPIIHQVSFSGAGDNALRLHLREPRRIIPGQKIHASILYANAYKPRASLGNGFDIPIVRGDLDVELDDGLWEMGLFDDSAARELITRLGDHREVDPICLDGLLFMLRTKEGKHWIRNVPDWRARFMNIISDDRHYTPLVRLVSIAAYHRASSDAEAYSERPDLNHVKLPQEIFDEAKECMDSVLAAQRLQDVSTVIALLRLLTQDQVLREHILTQDVSEVLMKLLDKIIPRGGQILVQAMDCLDYLLRYEDTRRITIEKLGTNLPNSRINRLSQILGVNDSSVLIVALRMVRDLIQIPESRPLCMTLKPRLRHLVEKSGRVVGFPAAEILLSLYDPNDREQSNIHDANVRANLAGALIRLNTLGYDLAVREGVNVLTGRQILHRLFGLDAPRLEGRQKQMVEELKMAIHSPNNQERVGATLTLLELCEVDIIRDFVRQINLLGAFIDQLKHKDSALLAAHALATCFKYSDMKESVENDELLPEGIVHMLRHNYFDDAVGRVEGFQILGDLMEHADLREKIKHHITPDLFMKLVKGKETEKRTSRICLRILQSFDHPVPHVYCRTLASSPERM